MSVIDHDTFEVVIQVITYGYCFGGTVSITLQYPGIIQIMMLCFR